MLHDNEPLDTIRQLIIDEYDAAETPIDTRPHIHTGIYDEGGGGQQITVTAPEATTVGGGATGITAGTGDGGAAQIKTESCLVDCWAGSRVACQGILPDGSNANPKDLSYKLAKHVANDIIATHSNGMIDGEPVFNSLSVPSHRRNIDSEATPTVFGYQLTVQYTYGTRTE